MSVGALFSIGAAGVGLGLQIYGIVKGAHASKDAAREQKKIDQLNIENYKKGVAESVGRTVVEQQKTQGMAVAQIGASGFAGGSSMDSYLQTLMQENSRDLNWMQTSGASQADILAKESEARARNANAARGTGIITGISGSLNTIGQGIGFASGVDWKF